MNLSIHANPKFECSESARGNSASRGSLCATWLMWDTYGPPWVHLPIHIENVHIELHCRLTVFKGNPLKPNPVSWKRWGNGGNGQRILIEFSGRFVAWQCMAWMILILDDSCVAKCGKKEDRENECRTESCWNRTELQELRKQMQKAQHGAAFWEECFYVACTCNVEDG